MTRVKMIDALRGFALLGILLVNVFVFHVPYVHYGEFYGAFEGMDAIAIEVMIYTCGGKFMFLFSFLFGWGVWIQTERRGNDFRRTWIGRMIVLMILGLLHIFFLWWGDILLAYGLFGLTFLVIHRWENRQIWRLIIAIFLFNGLLAIFANYLDIDPFFRREPYSLERMIEIYSEGGYLEILKLRLTEWYYFLPEQLLGYVPKQMVAMYLGFLAGRTGWLTNESRMSWTTLILMLILIVPFGIYRYDLFAFVDLENNPHWRPALILLNESFNLLLGIFWLVLFKKLWSEKSMLNWLSNLGRMSLTQYLLQSFICVIVFNGFGFGQYGQWSPIELLCFALGVFFLQVVLANTIFAKMKTGPMEMIYRKWSKQLSELF